MQRPGSIIVIEGDAADARRLVRLLDEMLDETGHGSAVRIEHVRTLQEGLWRVRQAPFDVAVVDLDLPDSTGLETLIQLRTAAPRLAVVVLTGDGGVLGVRTLQAGAQDYLRKGEVEAVTLARSLRYAFERQALLNDFADRTREEVPSVEEIGDAMGPDRDPTRRPLRHRRPTVFDAAARAYARAFDEHDGARREERAGAIADRFFALGGDAADVMDLHRHALALHCRQGERGERRATPRAPGDLVLAVLSALLERYRTAVLIRGAAGRPMTRSAPQAPGP